MTTGSKPPPPTTPISCTDPFGRRRAVEVSLTPITGQVLLVAPPAEAAVLNPAQAHALARELHRLARQAEAAYRLDTDLAINLAVAG